MVQVPITRIITRITFSNSSEICFFPFHSRTDIVSLVIIHIDPMPWRQSGVLVVKLLACM